MPNQKRKKGTTFQRILAINLPDAPAVEAIHAFASERKTTIESVDVAEALKELRGDPVDLLLIGVDSNEINEPEISALTEASGERTLTTLVTSDKHFDAASRSTELGVAQCLFIETSATCVQLLLNQMEFQWARTMQAIRQRRASESILRALPDLVIVLDRHGIYHEAISDKSSEWLFVVPPAEVVGRSVDEFFSKYYADGMLRTIEEVLRTRESRVFRYPLEIRGSKRWFSGHVAPLDQHDTERTIWVTRDITDTQELRENVADTRLLLDTAFDTLPMAIFWKDIDARFLGMNQTCVDALGARSIKDVIGKTDYDFEATAPLAEQYRDDDFAVMSSGEAHLGIVERIGKVGESQAWIRTNKVPLRNSSNSIIGVLGTFEDVTTEQLLLAEKHRQKELLETAQSLAKIGSWEFSTRTAELTWTAEIYRIYERDISQGPVREEELTTYYRNEFDAKRLGDAVRTCIKDGTPAEFELWLTTEEGAQKRVRHVIRRHSTHVTGGFVQDVTEAKERELAHRLATTLLESTQELTNVGSWEFNVKEGAVRWSDEMYDIFQLPRDDPMTFEKSISFWEPEEQTRMDALLRRCIARGLPYSEVTEFTLADGQHRFAHATARAIRNGDDEIIWVVGTLQDITERKKEREDAERRAYLLTQTANVSGVGGCYYNFAENSFEPTDKTREILMLEPGQELSIDEALDTLHPSGREAARAMLQRCLDTGEPFTSEASVRRQSGENFWCRVYGEADIEDGVAVGIYGAFLDITEERAELAAAEWSARLLEQTANASGIGGWRYSIEDDAMEFTPKFRELLDVPDDESLTLDEAFHFCNPEDLKMARAAVSKCISSGESFDFTIRARKSGGEEIWANITGAAKFRDGVPIEIYGAFQDVTRKRAQQEKQRAFEARVQHAQKLESLGVLAGGIAHDFNNLLVSMMGYASLAQNTLDEVEPAHELINNVVNAAQRAADLTKQLLAYSGKGQFVVEDIDLNRLVKEMGSILRIALPRGVLLKESYADNLPLISADRAQIAQVVMNLITNAGEAVGDRSGIVTVSTSVVDASAEYLAESEWDTQLEAGFYVCLEVSDTGEGMDRETRDKIFEPFFTTKFAGRGLGLAAVLGIVRGHEGSIRLYSESGRGTTFKVLLPISGAAKESLDSEPTTLAQIEGCALVVDDEPSIRAVARMVLQAAGMEVETANDGVDGIAKFRANPERYTVVLLDMTMPHIGGREAFREIRKIREDACVILSSGYAEQDATSGFEGKRLSGFIQKPYRPAELIAEIRLAMARCGEDGCEDC